MLCLTLLHDDILTFPLVLMFIFPSLSPSALETFPSRLCMYIQTISDCSVLAALLYILHWAVVEVVDI